mgnify:CR=1 FL=1
MAFNLRSGNASAFKSLGSSPAKKHVKGHKGSDVLQEFDARMEGIWGNKKAREFEKIDYKAKQKEGKIRKIGTELGEEEIELVKRDTQRNEKKRKRKVIREYEQNRPKKMTRLGPKLVPVEEKEPKLNKADYLKGIS